MDGNVEVYGEGFQNEYKCDERHSESYGFTLLSCKSYGPDGFRDQPGKIEKRDRDKKKNEEAETGVHAIKSEKQIKLGPEEKHQRNLG